MSVAKGDRVQFPVRVRRETRDRLDVLKAAGGHDGLSSLVEELVALRGDRDAELLRALEQVRLTRSLLDAAQSVISERDAVIRALRKENAGLRARVGARARAPPSTLPTVAQAAVEAAFRRDHEAGRHVPADLGMPEGCPACSGATSAAPTP